MSAESTRVRPASRQISTRRVASATSLSPQALNNSLPPPKVPVPRLNTGTLKPDPPSSRYSIVGASLGLVGGGVNSVSPNHLVNPRAPVGSLAPTLPNSLPTSGSRRTGLRGPVTWQETPTHGKLLPFFSLPAPRSGDLPFRIGIQGGVPPSRGSGARLPDEPQDRRQGEGRGSQECLAVSTIHRAEPKGTDQLRTNNSGSTESSQPNYERSRWAARLVVRHVCSS